MQTNQHMDNGLELTIDDPFVNSTAIVWDEAAVSFFRRRVHKVTGIDKYELFISIGRKHYQKK